MIKETSPLMLDEFKKFCTSVASDNSKGYQSVYDQSGVIKNKLLHCGSSIIPHFSIYLLSLKSNIYTELKINEADIDNLEQCCILLLCEIIKKYKINIDRYTSINGFDGWMEWGKNFDPDDPTNYFFE